MGTFYNISSSDKVITPDAWETGYYFLLGVRNSGNKTFGHSGFQKSVGIQTPFCINYDGTDEDVVLFLNGDAHLTSGVQISGKLFLIESGLLTEEQLASNTRIWAENYASSGIFNRTKTEGIELWNGVNFVHYTGFVGLAMDGTQAFIKSGEKCEYIVISGSGDNGPFLFFDKSSKVGWYTGAPRYKIDYPFPEMWMGMKGNVENDPSGKILFFDGLISGNKREAVSFGKNSIFDNYGIAFGNFNFVHNDWGFVRGVGNLAHGKWAFAGGLGDSKLSDDAFWLYEKYDTANYVDGLTMSDGAPYGLQFVGNCTSMNQALGQAAWAQNGFNNAAGNASKCEGIYNNVGHRSSAEGAFHSFVKPYSHTEGYAHSGTMNLTESSFSVSVPGSGLPKTDYPNGRAHIEGYINAVDALHASHVEGYSNTVSNDVFGHYEGRGHSGVIALNCHVEGINNSVTSSSWCHVEGSGHVVIEAQSCVVRGSDHLVTGVKGCQIDGNGGSGWINGASHISSNKFVSNGDAMYIKAMFTGETGVAAWMLNGGNLILQPAFGQNVFLPDHSIFNFDADFLGAASVSGYVLDPVNYYPPEFSWKTRGFVTYSTNSNDVVEATFGLFTDQIDGIKIVTGISPFLYFVPNNPQNTGVIPWQQYLDCQSQFLTGTGFGNAYTLCQTMYHSGLFHPNIKLDTGTRALTVSIDKVDLQWLTGLVGDKSGEAMRFTATIEGALTTFYSPTGATAERVCIYGFGTTVPPTTVPPTTGPPPTFPPSDPPTFVPPTLGPPPTHFTSSPPPSSDSYLPASSSSTPPPTTSGDETLTPPPTSEGTPPPPDPPPTVTLGPPPSVTPLPPFSPPSVLPPETNTTPPPTTTSVPPPSTSGAE